MSVQNKTKISLIKPNQGFWNKDLSYYKEYLDYVDKFNKAVMGANAPTSEPEETPDEKPTEE